MATRRLNDQETELLIQLWHDEPSLWDVSKGVYSNQDAYSTGITFFAYRCVVLLSLTSLLLPIPYLSTPLLSLLTNRSTSYPSIIPFIIFHSLLPMAPLTLTFQVIPFSPPLPIVQLLPERQVP